MNAPRIAKVIRKCGLFICRLAKPFVPESEGEKHINNLLKEVRWQDKLEGCTDRDMAKIVARVLDFPWGTEKSAVVCEVVDRLSRSPLGSNRLDDHGRRIFGIALNVRLLPNQFCDGCHGWGYVCDRSRLCLYCLGVKIGMEVCRQKATSTLRTRFVSLAADVREKMNTFKQPSK